MSSLEQLRKAMTSLQTVGDEIDSGKISVVTDVHLAVLVERITGEPLDWCAWDSVWPDGSQVIDRKNGNRPSVRFTFYAGSQDHAKIVADHLSEIVTRLLPVALRAHPHTVPSGYGDTKYKSAGKWKVELYVPIELTNKVPL